MVIRRPSPKMVCLMTSFARLVAVAVAFVHHNSAVGKLYCCPFCPLVAPPQSLPLSVLPQVTTDRLYRPDPHRAPSFPSSCVEKAPQLVVRDRPCPSLRCRVHLPERRQPSSFVPSPPDALSSQPSVVPVKGPGRVERALETVYAAPIHSDANEGVPHDAPPLVRQQNGMPRHVASRRVASRPQHRRRPPGGPSTTHVRPKNVGVCVVHLLLFELPVVASPRLQHPSRIPCHSSLQRTVLPLPNVTKAPARSPRTWCAPLPTGSACCVSGGS